MQDKQSASEPPLAATSGAAPDLTGTLSHITSAADTARRMPAAGCEEGLTAAQFLTALAELRELRAQIAGWEPDLIDAARRLGASWAQLAPALGVASRQAAERRYLRLRPDDTDARRTSTGDQRVRAERDRRAGQKAVDGWARDNASQLRQLAGQVGALDNPPGGAPDLDAVRHALGAGDTADLLAPLAAALTRLEESHPTLAAQITAVGEHTDEIRRTSDENRHHIGPE